MKSTLFSLDGFKDAVYQNKSSIGFQIAFWALQLIMGCCESLFYRGYIRIVELDVHPLQKLNNEIIQLTLVLNEITVNLKNTKEDTNVRSHRVVRTSSDVLDSDVESEIS